VEEVDDGPRGAGCAAEDGEHEEPGEEEDEDVGRPHARVHEPLRVLVQIRRRERLHVQLRHRRAPLRSLIASSPRFSRPLPPSPTGHHDTRARRQQRAVWAARCGCGGGIYRGGRPGSIDGAEEGRGRDGAVRSKRWGRKTNGAVRGTGGMAEARQEVGDDGTEKEGNTTGSGQSWRETSALGSRGPVSRFGLLLLDWLQSSISP
jgi:hypothetical protein